MNFEIVHIQQLKSTNSYALQLIEESVVNEGVVIWANEQTSGRGYSNNSWESEKGANLTCSLILKPVFIMPGDQFEITQLISVALLNVLQRILPDSLLKIKWPNDIYVDDKKIAGLLIQNIVRGQNIEYAVVGIGLNINQVHFKSSLPNPVSLIHILKEEYSVADLLKQILSEIDKIYTGAMSPRFLEAVRKKYLQNMRNYLKWAKYKSGEEKFNAKILGVDQFGRLILQMKTGEKRIFDFKEVESVINLK